MLLIFLNSCQATVIEFHLVDALSDLTFVSEPLKEFRPGDLGRVSTVKLFFDILYFVDIPSYSGSQNAQKFLYVDKVMIVTSKY